MKDDGTTTTHAVFVDDAPTASWYLVVATSSAVTTQVIQILEDADVVVGRAASSDIPIDHESVSRRHAILRRRADRITIEDLGSRNGTLVNGVAIDSVRRLTAGDVIAVGPMTAIVATSSAARNSRQVATTDELDARLESEVDRAHRYHRALALVMARFQGTADAITAHVDRLGGQLRRMDLLAEYGADEIAIVLPETERAAAEIVAARVAHAGETQVHVGIAVFPADGSSPGELISAARDRLRGVRGVHSTARSDVETALGGDIIVADPQMTQLFELAKRVAASTITVLIGGETGAGKEVVAGAIHRLSPRAAGPYVRLNCASLPESLVEAELFGHEKGAFTGAIGLKHG
ncbi:MAG: sigma 54-interacting transcriptional regulator, partial [Kofleriaceae bacterium]